MFRISSRLMLFTFLSAELASGKSTLRDSSQHSTTSRHLQLGDPVTITRPTQAPTTNPAQNNGCYQRWDPIKKKRQALWHTNSTKIMCQNIVENPKSSVRNKLCLCNNGKWQPLTYGGENGKVDVQFFGDILGAAKSLCTIVEGIDCWQSKPNTPKFPFSRKDYTDFTRISEMTPNPYINNTVNQDYSNVVKLVSPDGQIYYTEKFDIIGTVKSICNVINGGIGSIPGLIPNDGGGGGGGGLGGIIGIIGKLISGALDFFGIFKIQTAGNQYSDIKIYDNPEIAMYYAGMEK